MQSDDFVYTRARTSSVADSISKALDGNAIKINFNHPLDESIIILQSLVSSCKRGTVTAVEIEKVLPHVVDLLSTAKTRLPHAHLEENFTILELERSKSCTPEEQEVFDWITQEYVSRLSPGTEGKSKPTDGSGSPIHSPSSSSSSSADDGSSSTSSSSSSRSSTASSSSPTRRHESASDYFRTVEQAAGGVRIASATRSRTVSVTHGPAMGSLGGGAPEALTLIRSLLVKDDVRTALSKANSWDFDVFELHRVSQGRPLSLLSMYLFEELDMFKRFSIPKLDFARFITAIEDGYRSTNPYHNCLHAADVMQNAFFFAVQPSLADKITSADVLSILIAASIHDFQHPGTNNAFHVATGSDLAMKYNDRQVLENMHCAEAFVVMKTSGHDIFAGLGSSRRKELRESVISMVLATDMKDHFKLLSDMQTMIDKKRAAGTWFTHSNPEDRRICLEVGLHAADIANPTKPWGSYLQWTDRIMEEFYLQGDQERRLGLPISPMMDRSKPNVERSQQGFIDHIVKPLYETFSVVCPELSACCLSQLQANRAQWVERLQAAQQQQQQLQQQQQQQQHTAAAASSSSAPVSISLPPPSSSSSSSSSSSAPLSSIPSAPSSAASSPAMVTRMMSSDSKRSVTSFLSDASTSGLFRTTGTGTGTGGF